MNKIKQKNKTESKIITLKFSGKFDIKNRIKKVKYSILTKKKKVLNSNNY